jgi:psp operon transcriptional activator
VLDPFASPWRPSARSKAADAEAAGGTAAPTYPMDFTEAVRRYEIALLEGGLEASQFNQKRCAELLSMTYHQLRGLLRKYDLNTR